MYYIIYSSYATKPCNDEDLTELLVPSRQRNLFTGVTGVLFYSEGKFIQLIEGSETNIKTLYEKLSADPRHHNLQLHKQGEMAKRLFPDWTMAIKPISADNVDGILGFNDISSPNATSIESVITLYKALGDK